MNDFETNEAETNVMREQQSHNNPPTPVNDSLITNKSQTSEKCNNFRINNMLMHVNFDTTLEENGHMNDDIPTDDYNVSNGDSNYEFVDELDYDAVTNEKRLI